MSTLHALLVTSSELWVYECAAQLQNNSWSGQNQVWDFHVKRKIPHDSFVFDEFFWVMAVRVCVAQLLKWSQRGLRFLCERKNIPHDSFVFHDFQFYRSARDQLAGGWVYQTYFWSVRLSTFLKTWPTVSPRGRGKNNCTYCEYYVLYAHAAMHAGEIPIMLLPTAVANTTHDNITNTTRR